jgi:hypothetical protein
MQLLLQLFHLHLSILHRAVSMAIAGSVPGIALDREIATEFTA